MNRSARRLPTIEEPRALPTVEELWVAPELGCLHVLDAAIGASVLAIGAVYPEMQDNDPDDETESLRAALVVIGDARRLATSVAAYRHVLCRLRERCDRADDDPF